MRVNINIIVRLGVSITWIVGPKITVLKRYISAGPLRGMVFIKLLNLQNFISDLL